MKFFEKLLCGHKWAKFNEASQSESSSNGKLLLKYHKFILICKKCGKITKVDNKD